MLSFDSKDFRIFTTEEFFAEMRQVYERDVRAPSDPEVWEYLIIWLTTTLRFDEFLRGKYRNYVDRYAANKDVEKTFAVFLAHGYLENGQWAYEENGRAKSVQSWVKVRDGKFGCIACYLCNPASVTIKTKRSLLLLPDRDVGFDVKSLGVEKERFHLTLIHPKEGEIDDYTLDYHIRQLKAR